MAIRSYHPGKLLPHHRLPINDNIKVHGSIGVTSASDGISIIRQLNFVQEPSFRPPKAMHRL